MTEDEAPKNNEERHEYYSSCVRHALDRRKDQVRVWDDMRNLYEGKHWGEDEDCEQPVVNICWSTVNTISASTTIRNPSMSVNPLNPTSVTPAALMTKILNHDWERYRWQQEVQPAVKDGLVMGLGICKVGYYEASVPAVFDESGKIDSGRIRKDILKLSKLGMSGGTKISRLTDEDIANSLIDSVFNQGTQPHVLVDEHPLVERISPYDILVDPSVKQFRDSPWIAQRTFMSIKSIKTNTKWNRSAINNLSPVAFDSDNPTKSDDYKGGVAAIIEFYDLVDGTVCIFAEGSNDFLVAPMDIPYPFGHPFVLYVNESVPDKLWPIGEIQQIQTLQRELNATRSDIIEDRKAARRKVFVPEKILDHGKNRELLASSDENVMIPYDPLEVDPRTVFNLEVPLTSEHLYPESAMIISDMMYVTGVSDYQRGVSSGADTATEAAIINDASQSRIAMKLSKIETFMEEIAEKLIIIYQQMMRRERIVRFEGMLDTDTAREAGFEDDTRVNDTTVFSGGDMYRKISAADLAGEFDFNVEAGSSQPVNPTQKRQTAQQLAALLFPLAGTGMIDMKEVLRIVLEEGFQLTDVERVFTKQAPQAEQQNLAPGSSPGDGTVPLGGQVGPADRSAPVPTI